jgi:hypothetical protein
MKRSTFIATATTVGVCLPLSYYLSSKFANFNSVSQPKVLSQFNKIETLAEIGAMYRDQHPTENNKELLIKLLLTHKGSTIKIGDDMEIDKMLNEKMLSDFENHRTYVLKGWVVSETEARQCALLSLN